MVAGPDRAQAGHTYGRLRQQRREGSLRASPVARAIKTAGWRRLPLRTSLRSVRITRRAERRLGPANEPSELDGVIATRQSRRTEHAVVLVVLPPTRLRGTPISEP